MNIEVITMMYNEEFLAPFFMEHYKWVDKIHIILDKDTTDRTEEIVRRYPNVEVYPFRFPDMMDDEIKVSILNRHYQVSGADWVMVVDADEFIFHQTASVRGFLQRITDDVVVANLYQVYRHKDDKDLDPKMPAIYQRRHGDKNTGKNQQYNKPCIAKTGLNICWTPGNHFIYHPETSTRYNLPGSITDRGTKISSEVLLGAHWAMADPCFCIERRCKGRRDRQSKRNIEAKMTIQHHNITEAQVSEECNEHLNDGEVF
jgi:hypothetical protein